MTSNVVNTATTVGEITEVILGWGLTTLHPEYAGFVNVLTNIGNILELHSIKKFLIEVDNRLKNIGDSSVSQAYLSSPQFIGDLKQLLYIHERNDLEQKKELYVNYFENCCNCASISKINKERYFHLLQSIDIFALAVLKEIPERYVAACNKDSLVKLFYNTNEVTRDDVGCCVDFLIANGLAMYINEDDIKQYPNRYGNIRVRGGAPYIIKTDLGRGFLRFIASES